MMPSSKPRSNARFIPSEEIDAVDRWAFADINATELKTLADIQAAEQQRLALESDAYGQQRYQQGHADGWAAGLAAGFEQGQAKAMLEVKRQIDAFRATQGRQATQQLAACVEQLQQRLTALEQQIAQGVLELSCAMARQVVRRELALDDKALMAVIGEAVGLLLSEGKVTVLRLNPADLALLQADLQQEFTGPALMLRADPAVAPGGCQVECAGAVVDAALSKRWSRAIANLGLTEPWEMPEATP